MPVASTGTISLAGSGAGVLAPAPVPAPTGGTGVAGILGPLTALGLFAVDLVRLAESEVRGVPAQAAVVRAGFSAALSVIPGLNLLFAFSQGIRAIPGLFGTQTPSEFRAQEEREDPSPLTGLQAPGGGAQLDALIAADPDFQRRLRESGERLRNERLRALVSFDPRTGAGQSARTKALEEDPDRIAKLRAIERLQRVRFQGIPGIFTRRSF